MINSYFCDPELHSIVWEKERSVNPSLSGKTNKGKITDCDKMAFETGGVTGADCDESMSEIDVVNVSMQELSLIGKGKLSFVGLHDTIKLITMVMDNL